MNAPLQTSPDLGMKSYRIRYLGVDGKFHYDDLQAAHSIEAIQKFLRAHPGIPMGQCIGFSP